MLPSPLLSVVFYSDHPCRPQSRRAAPVAAPSTRLTTVSAFLAPDIRQRRCSCSASGNAASALILLFYIPCHGQPSQARSAIARAAQQRLPHSSALRFRPSDAQIQI